MQILRSIAAIVLGLVVAMGTISAVHAASGLIYPLPEGVDPKDTAKLREVLPTMPTGAFLMVVLAWESGAFVGGFAAAFIAGRARCVHAGIIGGLILAATVANIIILRAHPDWVILAGLLLPLPVSLLAGKAVSMLMHSPPTDTSIPASTP